MIYLKFLGLRNLRHLMHQKKITFLKRLLWTKGRRRWLCRLLAGGVGLILLIAGLSKATDIDLFIREIRGYDIIANYVLSAISAWVLIALEFTLGVALLLFYRPRRTIAIAVLLFLIFIGASLLAWFSGATEDCGCFGIWMKRTPKVAALESLILLGILVLAWIGHGQTQETKSRAKTWLVATACVAGLTLPVAMGFPISRINLLQPHHFGVGPDFKIQGLNDIDINNGTYLIILTDIGCSNCQEVLPELNTLAQAEDLPEVIALCTNEELQREEFVKEFCPDFPIGQIDEDTFWRLLGHSDIPLIILMHDGSIRHTWDRRLPDRDRLRKVCSLLKSDQTP